MSSREELGQYRFTRRSAACTVRVASFGDDSEGILIVVQSEEATSAAYHDCRNLLEDVVGAVCNLLSPSQSSVGVVSSLDLKKNEPEPHVYSEKAVDLSLQRGLLCFRHPLHGPEFLNSLLLQSLAPSELCDSGSNLLEECIPNAQVRCT